VKKVYLVPNFITTVALFCGFYSIISSIEYDYDIAAWLIVAAGVFDMLDGRIARLAKATSQFGVEYDSLSDLVSFGVAPSILVYKWALFPFGRLGWLAGFLYLSCGALRLARFNVTTEPVSKPYFKGLPITLAAQVLALFILFYQTMHLTGKCTYFILGLLLILSSLMVSTIKFPSYRELNWKSSATFGYLMVGILAMILIAAKPEVILFLLLPDLLIKTYQTFLVA
jgi:CDP-diacylglycerol--serine O-phosphatidyltransferase